MKDQVLQCSVGRQNCKLEQTTAELGNYIPSLNSGSQLGVILHPR